MASHSRDLTDMIVFSQFCGILSSIKVMVRQSDASRVCVVADEEPHASTVKSESVGSC